MGGQFFEGKDDIPVCKCCVGLSASYLMAEVFYQAGASVPTLPSGEPAPAAAEEGVASTESGKAQTILQLLPYFLTYAQFEWRYAPHTLKGYRENIHRIVKVTGDIRPEHLTMREVLTLKADLGSRQASAYHVRNIVNTLRSFLRFCRLIVGLEVFDPKAIKLPPIPRREVVYLTREEIERFLEAIPVYRNPKTKTGPRMDLSWLMFRALVEVLLATGMRISEALSLKRNSINLETGEAEIVGKGNKQRTVFFTPRALGWVKEYLNRQKDSAECLFALPSGRPLVYDTARVWFSRIRSRAGLKKRITAHILRHTCATLLLFNGCPIGHIKEILGHERLETTCRYYLGVDKNAAKEAHRKYLAF